MEEKQQDGRRKKRPGVEEQREIIFQAAVELFVERGTQNTSIAQICTHADVSKPTFYRCFKDKDALVSTLYEHSVNEHVTQLMEAMIGDSIEGRVSLDDALDTLLDAIFNQANLVTLLFREYSDPMSPAATIIDETFERIAKKLDKRLRETSANPPSKTFLKAMMSAFQWVIYDAIKAGLAPRHIKQAKQASHELAAAMVAQSLT